MTSPVERISGPSKASTPGKRLKGKTASFTATWLSFFVFSLKSASFSPAMTRAAILATGIADDLGHERHRARGARVHFEDIDHIILHRELHVHQADDIECERQLFRLRFKLGNDGGLQ